MNENEIRQKVAELGPWHYCHILPYGISTGDCTTETIHAKLAHLLKAKVFNRPNYPRVLDLGANSGIISMWFVDNRSSIVDAVEAGPKYYPQLEFAVDVKGYQNKVIPIKQDITDCNFELVEYDLILFLGTLHHIEEKFHLGVIEACHDALLPGGEIVIQTKNTLPVAKLMKQVGLLGVELLNTYWSDRAAWYGFKDPMKI